ncbi:MAG TPA: 30S ribosomal protein S19 [Candidatus Tyrphobacter sp.]|nr:30S ribosomal protein S19 [Candidatus Tyrphobacter sp.]
MSRSLKKGPYVDARLLAKVISAKAESRKEPVKTWSRASEISPEMIGATLGVHNGKEFISVFITEEMVGHRLGEFSPSKKFLRHGGKIQKAEEAKTKA